MIEYTARLMAREDTPRYKNWLRVFGASAVYLVDPLPKRADLPGRAQALIYLGDFKRLAPHQQTCLVHHLATTFELPPETVADELLKTGAYPILAEDVWVFYGTARWMI